jgi:O-antigen ligase/polysaccharide polymerase Wzy-like membrane protein
VSARRLPAPQAHAVAFGGLLLFTALLYLRPNELLPIGTFPIVRIITIGTLVAFFVERLGQGGPISVMPRPFKYLLIVAGLTILSIPFGLDPAASFDGFTDLFLKILLVFLLTINVVTSFRRLRLLMEITVVCAAIVGLLTLSEYAQGKNLVADFRAAGALGGAFKNPNDLALAMNVLLPIAFGLGLSRPHPLSKLLYLACAAVLVMTTVVTQSRAGFLTVVIAGGFFVVQIGRRYPAAWAVGALAAVMLLASSPGRVLSMLDASGGSGTAAESASTRWELVKRSLEVAGANPVRWLFGVGMENFHIVSIKELVSHNAYLQVFNEVGLPAMIFYILFLSSVIGIAARIAKRFRRERRYRQIWLIAVAIETSLVAYAVGSFFASVAFQWYLYYPAAFAVCLQQILPRTERLPAQKEVPSRVWYLRRVQH